MPRLPQLLLRQARRIDPLLPLLLRPCRDLESAQNELRWLRDHVKASANDDKSSHLSRSWSLELGQLCLDRARGKPLQYILGDQPFGPLNILCRKGVLIPRRETESVTQHLTTILANLRQTAGKLKVLDLCTGTGCISLLIHSLLVHRIRTLQILGVDVDPSAVKLARQNLQHNIASGQLSSKAGDDISFVKGDVLKIEGGLHVHGTWDLLISNPPYISPRGFNESTSRSVRNFEPRIALVPSPHGPVHSDDAAGDLFYPRLIEMACRVQAKLLLFEIGDLAQAKRVVSCVSKSKRWAGCEIWRDWPDQPSAQKCLQFEEKHVKIRGRGQARAVFAWSHVVRPFWD